MRDKNILRQWQWQWWRRRRCRRAQGRPAIASERRIHKLSPSSLPLFSVVNLRLLPSLELSLFFLSLCKYIFLFFFFFFFFFFKFYSLLCFPQRRSEGDKSSEICSTAPAPAPPADALFPHPSPHVSLYTPKIRWSKISQIYYFYIY